jgi:membrane fusion protein, multidrug efflux system
MSEKQNPPVLEDVALRTAPPLGGGPRWAHHLWTWLLLLAVAAAGAYFYRTRHNAPPQAPAAKGAPAGRSAGPTPVVAVKAQKGNIGVYVVGLGSVTPVFTVTVKSQIGGYLTEVRYQEGQMVHQGDLLAVVDPRPYQVQLEQYQGQLLRDQATLDNAKVDLQRYQTLLTHNAVPEQTFATQQATVKQDEGVVQTDQANIDAAKLNLTYCHITAPITGRVGLRLVDPGNYISAGDSTGLVVITQLQPITVVFPISEDQLPPVLDRWRSGARLSVEAYDRTMSAKLGAGWLTTIDNEIDPTTGTVKLRATFNNSDEALFPNQFVNARLLVQEKHGVTIVPTAVIQRNTQSTYVYLVKPDSTVTVRQVKVGTTEGNESQIDSGVAPGDTIVMSGVDRLQEGSKVRVTIESPESRS